MVLIFAFVTFIFLKVATAVAFGEGMTVLAALLIAVIYAAAMLGAQILSAPGIAQWATHKPIPDNPFSKYPIFETFLPHALAISASVAISLAILIGFSGRFWDQLTSFYSGNDFWMYVVLAAIPGFVHWCVSLPLFAMAGRPRE